MYAVFGSAGKRDKVKRKVLGEIANRHCDTIFVTEEDPRDESAREIADMIMEGIDEGKGVFIENRYEAIETAIRTAKAGDCVLILGKGAEMYLDRGNGKDHWMGDVAAAKEIVGRILK